MSKNRNKSRRPKNKRHRRIPIETKELVLQYRSLGVTINDIAKKTLLSYPTVEYILRRYHSESPESAKIARAKALDVLAAKVNEKALMALDHITEDSVTHDRVVTYNEDGTIKSISHSGPTGQQIALTAGILLDKAAQMDQRAAVLRGEAPLELGPDGFEALKSSILGRISKLTEISGDINMGTFKARVLELKNDADELAEENMVDADYEEISE